MRISVLLGQQNVSARMAAVSERFADHVTSLRFEDIPGDVVEHAKDLLVNQLALAFSGRYTDDGRRAIQIAHQLSDGAATSTLVGERRRVAMLDAIFAHSVFMGNVLDDYTLPTILHIGRISHPVAWVLGEREHASGRELITAVVAGYDVACRLSDPSVGRDSYARPVNVAFSPFAAVAVAARLLRLDVARAAHAIAQAAHIGMGVTEGVEIATTGMIARNAVLAALIAEPGTDRLRTIESEHGLYPAFFHTAPVRLEDRLASLGREFAIMTASTKSYPGSGSHVYALELTKAIMDDDAVGPDDVEAIVASIPEDLRARFEFMEARIETRERTETDIARSLRVKLAILLVRREPVHVPTRRDLDDPAVEHLLPKVSLRYEPGRPIGSTRVDIRTRDGRHLERERGFAPAPKGDWSKWLRRDGERFLSDARLTRLESLLAALENVHDVGEVMACTVPDEP